jgi:hypothetical protein
MDRLQNNHHRDRIIGLFMYVCMYVCMYVFILAVLGFEIRAFYLLDKHPAI